jgi:hypothetical protein
LLFYQPFNGADVKFLLRRGKRNGVAAVLGSPGAANSVHVISGLFGQVKINNYLYAENVYAAGGNIGGYQYAVFSQLKAV